MALAIDPYYYSRDLMKLQSQQKALGRTGFNPQDLSAIIRANFQAQQENETTQRELALKEKAAALDEESYRENLKVQKQQNKSSGIMGATSLAIQAPLAYKEYAKLFGSGTGATGTALTGSTAGTGTTAATNVAQSSAVSSGGATGTSALGAAAGVAGTSALAYQVGSNVIHGKHSKQAGIGASVIAGWIAGSQAGSVGGPWGAVIGGVVGALSSIF